MAGYIGSKASVTQVDGYNRTEADARYANITGDTFTGAVTGTNLTLSGGVYLGGTGAANLLDDYEEGTWTGSVGRSGFNTAVSSVTGERYIKVGRMVYVECLINLSSAGYNLDYSRIDGLPFTCSDDGLTAHYGSGAIAGNGQGGKGIFGNGSTSLYLYDAVNTVTGTGWRVSGWYHTDA